jgi:hypothetical protein
LAYRPLNIECPAERRERHRRASVELGEQRGQSADGFDIDSAPDAEPMPANH